MRKGRGFTLIELLVVIAIIAILAAILFPVIVGAKESARQTKCASNMKQINMAIIAYVDDFDGRFPDARGRTDPDNGGIWYSYIHQRIQCPNVPLTDLGPYIQDLVRNYVKNNKQIWNCPTINPKEQVPDYAGVGYSQFTWERNAGTTPACRKVWTNYMWIHIARSVKQDKAFRVSGSSTSEVKRPSRAVMLMEMPYWEGAIPPHKTDGYGINVAFFDGHVRMERNPVHAYLNLSWQGWDLR